MFVNPQDVNIVDEHSAGGVMFFSLKRHRYAVKLVLIYGPTARVDMDRFTMRK